MTDNVTSGVEPPGQQVAPPAVRVLLVDDDLDVRELVDTMLGQDPRFEVVARAGDAQGGIRMADLARPDVVVCGLQSSGDEWVTTLKRLRACLPDARIVVLSPFPDPFTLLDAVRSGADACIDKLRAWSELVPTLTGLCKVA